MKLSEVRSGYTGSPSSMEAFLMCWAREVGIQLGAISGDPAPNLDPRLSKSALDFVAAARRIGFKSLYDQRAPGADRFADPSQLQLFSQAFPADYQIWQTAFRGIDIPDDKYYLYQKGQETAFRGRQLPTMLVIGSERGGTFYLLIPDEKTIDGENETLILHHGGLIVRFKSFAHLLVHLYLEEREFHAGRDASLGHLYHFPGSLRDTCAKLVIDV